MTVHTEQDGKIALVMDEMPYGVYIVGSRSSDGELNGMMADWVMQVSFHPRLVAVAFEQDAHTLQNIRETRRFSVSLLPEDEAGRRLAAKFAQPYMGAKVSGRSSSGTSAVHHKMDVVPHFTSPNGSPVLTGGLAWLECEVQELIPTGDHTTVIGRITNGEMLQEGNPLTSLYSGWTYSG